MKHFSQRVVNKQLIDYHNCVVNHHITTVMYIQFMSNRSISIS